MKQFYTIIIFLLFSVTLSAQAPSSFKYQAVLRDARGNTKANTKVTIIIDILQGSTSGIKVYSETHNVTTDTYGLINLEIGKGTSTLGSISGIDWSEGPYFIRVTVDGIEMGTNQLLSVPYALYAKTAGNGFSGFYNDLKAKPLLFDGTWTSLTGKPVFATVSTSGSYNDLINKPVIFSGAWASLTGKPTYATVATTGSYNDLLNKPILFDGTWTSLTGKPSFSTVAITGIYNDLTNKPTGQNLGDMQYWNGTDWVMIPVGKAGQYLQLTTTNLPSWTGPAYATVVTTPISLISQNTATTGGNITNDGGATITARGVCWSTSENPTIALSSKTTDGSGTGSFTSSIAGLAIGTTYYVRAYTTNSVGTIYGVQLKFSTLAFPDVTTTSVSSITQTTASSGGNVTSDGGAAVISRGVCWGTTANPTIANSRTTNGTGTGTYTSSITGLTIGTTYYLRAYATNSVGTSYGDGISFQTTITTPTITTTAATAITQTTASGGGNVTSDGGATVTSRGVCWNTTGNPTITNSKTTDGTGTGTFASSITSLTSNTKYYLKAYAINSAGTVYGNEINFTTNPATVTTPWKVADSIIVRGNLNLLTCNDNYVFLTNLNQDSVFVTSIQTKNIILKKALKVSGYSLLKGNVFINPTDEYSFNAYNISDIQNWLLINTFTGLDKGILYWQFYSSLYDDNYYYWIGHWNNSVQIFEITSNSVIKHSKFDVGIHSQSVTHLGNFLYVANNYGNNRKFDITNLDIPVNKGDFGNTNTNYSGTTAAGFVVQNHYSGWGGGVDNINIYDLNNIVRATLSNNYVSGSAFLTLANGYCIVNEGIIKVYNISNGTFVYDSDLLAYSTHYNNKYIVAMLANKILLINRKLY